MTQRKYGASAEHMGKLALRCPNCRAGITSEDRFCAHCGTPLKRWISAARTTQDERKHIAILFADLIGSTRHLENRDPEDARRLLITVLDIMIDAVRNSSGIVNQVMGDGIMAMFGAPVADENHALNACIAAIRMHEGVARYAHDNASSMNEGVLIRVGIHTGEVVVAGRGDGFDSQYTAFGEATHIAARLERLASPGTTVISASTHALVRGHVLVEPLGPTTLRGLSRPVETFELRAVRIGRQKRHSSIGQDSLIGRARQLALMRERLTQAGSSNGQIVALHGEAGVGKSRLTAEFAAEATQRGWLVLESTAEHLQQIPYFPVRDALKTHLLLDTDPAVWPGIISRRLQALGASERHQTALLGLFGINTRAWENLPGAVRRQDITDAVIWLVLAESEKKPVLWIMEDLQWADAESQTLLARLAEAIGEASVLLLLNHRPEYQTPLAISSRCTRIEVARLSGKSLSELLEKILGSDASLLPLKIVLGERTGGNPFFIEECVRSLVDAGTLEGRLGAFQLVGQIENLIPGSVQGILAARIDQLPFELKRMLQYAAVLGHRVDPQILQNLTGTGPDEMESRMAALCASGFLTSTMDFSGSSYMFVHALSQDVAYRGILQEAREQLHADVLRIMESLYADRLADQAEVLGLHASAGRQWSKAAHYLRMAARKALSQSACEVALLHLNETMRALEHLPDNRMSKEIAHDVRLERRNALFPLARHTEMLICLTEAEQIAAGLQDIARQARSAAHLCHCYWLMGDPRNAAAAGRRGLAMAERTGEIGLLIWARFFKALAHYGLAEFPDAIALLNANAAALAGELRANRLGGFSLPAVVGSDWLSQQAETGAFAAALQAALTALRVADEAGYPFDRVHGLIAVGSVHLMRGALEPAIAPLQEALAACETRRIVSLRPRVLALLALAKGLAGHEQLALTISERAMQGGASHGALRPLCMRAQAEVLLLARRFDNAAAVADELLDLARGSGQRGLEAWALRAAGESQAGQGHSGAARRLLWQSHHLAGQLGMQPLIAHCLRALATVTHLDGAAAEAAQTAEQADLLYRRLNMTGPFAGFALASSA
jgi:class 3 adenylate cyclase